MDLGIHEVVRKAVQTTEMRYAGELHITPFFLDDGLATGSWRAVKFFLELLKGLDDKGLKMCLDKTEIIPTAPDHLVPLNAFTDFEVNETGNLNFLGAPFGSKEHCTNHT